MAKRIIYTRADGHVSVFMPAPDYIAKFPDEASGIADIQANHLPAGATNINVIDQENILSSRAFRNAWKIDAGALVVDMPEARVIKTAQIRRERDRQLAETDIEIIKLDGLLVPEVLKTKRQALRDLPANLNLDTIITPEDLENFEPDWPK